jgi:hypothetical protein
MNLGGIGNRQGSMVADMTGQTMESVPFSWLGPACFCGPGRLPDSIGLPAYGGETPKGGGPHDGVFEPCAHHSEAFARCKQDEKAHEERRISFADTFAFALAARRNIPLITPDQHEFDAVEQKRYSRIMWLR